MIRVRRKWMSYTYFNHTPRSGSNVTHLHAFSASHGALRTVIPFHTMVVDIAKQDFVKYWSSSTRTKINKAFKENLVADRGRYLLPDILNLFSSVAKVKGLRGYPVSHFDAFPNIECSAIVYEGTMICGHVWLIDPEEKRALLYVNATNRFNLEEDKSMTGRANYFLLWQDGLHLRNLGITVMDLMGFNLHDPNPALRGVSKWKAGTHGREEMQYHHYPIWFFVLRKLRNMLPR